jgi:thiamine-monophosphate kinase
MMKLSDVGEFRLLRDVVLPVFGSNGLTAPLGDDCAYVSVPRPEMLVVTTDAAPRPLVWSLGCESYWSWGWYAVIINVSDLAAAGARPLFFTSSVDASDSMLVKDFQRFFEGMAAACERFSLTNAGGNIRAAPRFACHATAVGTEPRSVPITRSACVPGDAIVAVGPCGLFISAYLQGRRNGLDSLSRVDRRRLFRPEPQMREMGLLHEAGMIRAASDNSDGLLGAIWNIVDRSQCGVELLLDEILLPPEVQKAARDENFDPWNLFCFWGDWQVICAVAPEQLKEFNLLAEAEGIEYTLLGRAIESEPAVYGSRHGRRRRMRVLRSENFAAESFSSDLSGHLDHMLRTPLLIE